jgi:dihydroneopterin aldolase
MAQDTFKSFGEGVHSLESNLSELKGHTEDHFHDIIEHLGGPIASALKDTFEHATQGFAQTITSNFTGQLGELGGNFTSLFNTFGQTAEEVGQDLIKTGEDIFKDMVEHAEQEVTQKIAQTVEHAIEEVIEELVQELVEHIVEGTAGAAVTAAIGEFVPLLAICKAILPIIDELIKAMTLGLG